MEISKRGKTSEVDRISNLPDPILNLILSGLPTTEEVIRTSILSTRWRYLWTSIPFIDIDCFRGLKSGKKLQKDKFEEFVNRILANKSINFDSFRMNCGFNCNMSTVGQWIDAAVRRNVTILDVSFSLDDEYEYIELPLCLVTCASLEVLKLSLFAHRLILPQFTGFPALRALELNCCKLFKDDLVKDFFNSCQLLEDLILVDCLTHNLSLFCISCPKLKNLRIDNREIQDSENWDAGIEGLCHHLQICCPNLVSLEFVGFMAFKFILESLDSLKKVVIHPLDNYMWADNNLCELFVGFFHVESLSLRMCLIQKYYLNLQDLPESLPNLKTLEITTHTDAYSMFVLMQILKCFSNLESLHLIIQKGRFSTEGADSESWEMECDCIFERLETVNMAGMSDAPHHMILIELLLESSPCLETMSITPSVKMTTSRKLSFTVDLLTRRRASPEAEIIFVQDRV